MDNVIPNGAGADRPRVALSDDVISFIESGVSIVMAVVGPTGRAHAGRALAARVLPDATLRIIFPHEGNDAITAAVQTGGPIAVTFSAPLSHRTLQIKGLSSRPEELDPVDLAMSQTQCKAFAGVIAAAGHPPAFVQAFMDYCASTPQVLSFPAHEAYEQTPGPGAGRSL
jgi:hypothetical protein